ncbi:hypothetical protein ES707_10126 [subsurface metagenome]
MPFAPRRRSQAPAWTGTRTSQAAIFPQTISANVTGVEMSVSRVCRWYSSVMRSMIRAAETIAGRRRRSFRFATSAMSGESAPA